MSETERHTQITAVPHSTLTSLLRHGSSPSRGGAVGVKVPSRRAGERGPDVSATSVLLRISKLESGLLSAAASLMSKLYRCSWDLASSTRSIS